MPLGPRPSDIPRIRTALAVYRVSAIITGIFLLMLVRDDGASATSTASTSSSAAPSASSRSRPRTQITAINLSTAILIAHGWLYVLYLGCDFVLWRLVRLSFGRFLFIALGGIIPFLSFYFEFQVPPYVEKRIAAIAPRPVSAEVAA